MEGLDLLSGTVKSGMLMEGDCSPSSLRSVPLAYAVDEVVDIWPTYPRAEDGPRSGAFIPVILRGVTANPACLVEAMGISFDCEDGRVIRLLITLETARMVVDYLSSTCQRFVEFTNSHSDNSSGSPSVEVSTPEE